MKWVLIGIAVVGGLIALVAAIGAFVPRTHVATRSMRLAQPPDSVWSALTDFERHPSWRTSLKAIERAPDREGHPVWVETDARNGRLPIEYVEMVPPTRLVGRIADSDLPFGGTWTYEVEPADGGIRVRITERGEISNVFFRFMARFVFGYTATMEAYLRALAGRFGEEAGIEA